MEFADLRKKLEEINLSIESHSFDVPKDLERRRAAIQHQLDDIVYPILTIPPEIISEIFRRCMSNLDDASDTASTSRAPLLFLRICRPWRVIALSTPMLWTEFNVAFLLLRPQQLKSLEKHVAEWTARASAAPLSLGFHDFAGRLAPERMSMLLHQYASRLGALRLRTMLTTLSGLPDIGSLPLLQKLTLGYSPVAHDTSSVRIFRNAPQLREVTLEQSTVPSIFILPWHQLTTFTADRISVIDCLFVLRSAAHLTTCTFLYLLPEMPGHRSITHASLRDFSISNGAGNILQYLDLPSLRDLYLTKVSGFPLDAFLQLLTGCATSLRRFHYYPIYRNRGLISAEWFRITGRLTYIDLGGMDARFQREFMSLLDRTRNAGFLPHLCTLQIACEACEVGGELVAALASRAPGLPGTVLAEFRMISEALAFRMAWEVEGGIEDVHLDALQGLVMRGMRIHIGPRAENYVWS
ncbi:hypothetical protein DFH09DRAFT_1173715 [Mycena vulgaris]|nr:hypothetical protein DFH09DRAFT_1173715 [Mycena vulgaris]